MDPLLFLKGILAGLIISFSVGPVGVLCVRRAVSEGVVVGFAVGLGAVVADTFYGGIAAFGLRFIRDFLLSQRMVLHVVGGGFLLWLGVRIFRAGPPAESESTGRRRRGMIANFLVAFYIAISNPFTVVLFLMIFGYLNATGTENSMLEAGTLLAGVCAGTAGWWLGLSFGAALLRRRFRAEWFCVLNRVAGVIVFAFGGAIMARGFAG